MGIYVLEQWASTLKCFVAPTLLAAFYTLLFARHAPFEVDEYARAHMEFTLAALSTK